MVKDVVVILNSSGGCGGDIRSGSDGSDVSIGKSDGDGGTYDCGDGTEWRYRE